MEGWTAAARQFSRKWVAKAEERRRDPSTTRHIATPCHKPSGERYNLAVNREEGLGVGATVIPMAKRELEERKWQETLYNSISLPTKRNGPAFAKFRQEAGATSTPVEKQGTKNTVYSSTGGPTKRKEPWQSGKQGRDRFRASAGASARTEESSSSEEEETRTTIAPAKRLKP